MALNDVFGATTAAARSTISRFKGAYQESIRDTQDRIDQNSNNLNFLPPDFKDDVRILPRTNLVKRLRSITFILEGITESESEDAAGGKVINTNSDQVLSVHTLLIAPQSYQQSEPNRSTVVQTLGGAFIDDFGLGLKQITISGTTGYSKRMVVEKQPYENQNSGAATVMATDGYHAFKKLRNDIYRAYFDLDKKTITGETNIIEGNTSGLVSRNQAIGYPKDAKSWQENNQTLSANIASQESTVGDTSRIRRQIQKGSEIKQQASAVLKMYYWGNEDYYVVHPLNFSFTQSSDEPLLYRYTIELLVMRDLNDAEAEYGLAKAAQRDPFTNLVDARYRCVRANQQINRNLLRLIVEQNYNDAAPQYLKSQGAFNSGQPLNDFGLLPSPNPATLRTNISPLVAPRFKQEPTLVASNVDWGDPQAIRDMTDPNYTYGELANRSFRDMRGRTILDIEDTRRAYDQTGGRNPFLQAVNPAYYNSYDMDRKKVDILDVPLKSYTGDFKTIVVDKSYDEALLRGMDVTKLDVNEVFDVVHAYRKFYTHTGDLVPEELTGMTPEQATSVVQEGKKNRDRVNEIIDIVNEARKDTEDFVNGRETKIPRTIEEWRQDIRSLYDLENSIIALPESLIPYELVNNVRSLICEIQMVTRFPELFQDAIENAIQNFRDLLKGSGCSQTL